VSAATPVSVQVRVTLVFFPLVALTDPGMTLRAAWDQVAVDSSARTARLMTSLDLL
jgi:hypothetical protein